LKKKNGKSPNEFIALAKKKGLDKPEIKAGEIVNWLKEDFDLGRGHAMALVHVIKNGSKISGKHVGTKGVHRDEKNTLDLNGKKK